MNGYHEFYRATSLHKGVPLHVVSLWNTIILGIQTIMQNQYGREFFTHCHYDFSPTVYVVIFCALETVILLATHGYYIKRVYNFNRSALPPDAYRGLSESLSSVCAISKHFLFDIIFFLCLNSSKKSTIFSVGWCGPTRCCYKRFIRKTSGSYQLPKGSQ